MQRKTVFLSFLLIAISTCVFSQDGKASFWSASGMIGENGRFSEPDVFSQLGLGPCDSDPIVDFSGSSEVVRIPNWSEVCTATIGIKVAGPASKYPAYSDWPEILGGRIKATPEYCYRVNLLSDFPRKWTIKKLDLLFDYQKEREAFPNIRTFHFLSWASGVNHRNLLGVGNLFRTEHGWYRLRQLKFIIEPDTEFGALSGVLDDAHKMWVFKSENQELCREYESDCLRYAKAIVWNTRYVPQGFSPWPEDPTVLAKNFSDKYAPKVVEATPPAVVDVPKPIWAIEFVGFSDDVELKLWIAPISVPKDQLDQLAQDGLIPYRFAEDKLDNGNRAIIFQNLPVSGCYWYRLGDEVDWHVMDIDTAVNAVINRQ